MPGTSLAGTWQFVSFELRDEGGTVARPFGRDSPGFNTYTADGCAAVQFGRAAAERRASQDRRRASSRSSFPAGRCFTATCVGSDRAKGSRNLEGMVWLGRQVGSIVTEEFDPPPGPSYGANFAKPRCGRMSEALAARGTGEDGWRLG